MFKNFLNEEPETLVTNTNFWKTEKDVESAVYELHVMFRSWGGYVETRLYRDRGLPFDYLGLTWKNISDNELRKDAQELWVRLELKVIADVGLVGFPNVGKSTFLSRVTNARPKIANYHFTTLNPNLGVVDLDGGKGFVIADIPGLIEGASEGVGLGHQFLRHIERTKVIIHIVDAASTEGRDPIADIKAINKELENYNPKLLERPQVIAANKIDVIYDDGSDPVQAIRDAFEPEDIKVYPISAVTGQGVKELLYAVRTLLDNFKDEPVLFEKEFDYDELMDNPNESFEVSINEDGVYVVNGPKIDKMLGYTNLESEKGFDFFQKFMKRSGVLDELEKLGIEEGDTVIVGDYLEFDYYKA